MEYMQMFPSTEGSTSPPSFPNFYVLSLCIYLATECDFEEEVQNRIGQTQTQRMLQVHFVALENIIGILGTPVEDDPDEMILQHGNCRIRNIALLCSKSGIQILLILGRQFLDDDGRIGNLLAIELDERQLTLLGTETHLMIDIL